MEVNRETLLQTLEMVTPGLASRDVLEQSSSFVFGEKQVQTFNGEIYCCHATDLDIEGAVPAAPLLSSLRKLTEDTLEISIQNGEELIVEGRRRKLGITLEREIFLPIDKVDIPSKWKKLPPVYAEAVNIVGGCASRDEARYMLMCVHIHPKWIEACDNYHLCRYVFDTGVGKSCFVKQDSIKHMTDLGMTRYAETESWVHFKNPSGLVFACRRVVDQDYPDLAPILKERGQKTVLPKGLAEAAEKAAVFSSENPDNSNVMIDLKPGKLRISGRGNSGWYREVKDLTYKGQSMSFSISPELLTTLVKSYSDCEVNERYLRVDGGSYTYVTCLGVQEESNGQG